MLISSQIGPVDSSYKPGLGEEVYDTITQANYRGDGMTAVSGLESIVPDIPTATTFFVPASEFDGTVTGDGNAPYPIGKDCPEDADTTLQSGAFQLPVGWSTVKVDLLFLSTAAEAAVTRWGIAVTPFNISENDYDDVLDTIKNVTTPAGSGDLFTLEASASLNLLDAFTEFDFVSVTVNRYGTNVLDVGTASVIFLGVLFTNAA